ncbi:hypothetical protein [Bythopirellula polymerisocia]|uniref:Uncharacterized protein n=1 Tax=Bythopirellula polymerisocia TaxID=2528003 RepID=A0A5C6D3Q3_9BACT|nr:hypothetical protein [Bythopirellula polymerisocia]TWU29856.1 hypothetical protein Pla144_06360 [Bythopirellula polymerisocia]
MNWEKLIPSAFIVFFPLFWIGICFALSWMGGWGRLAREYREHESHDSQPIRTAWMRSGRFGWVNYNSCLNIGIHDAGLRLSVLFPFRVGHPPLFIPWGAMASARQKRIFFFRFLEIQVGEPEPVTVLLPEWVGEYLEL